jgi:hypothetical protein
MCCIEVCGVFFVVNDLLCLPSTTHTSMAFHTRRLLAHSAHSLEAVAARAAQACDGATPPSLFFETELSKSLTAVHKAELNGALYS